MKSYKSVTVELHPEEAVNGAIQDLRDLGDELRQWCEGMSGTNLENGDKYSTLNEAAEALETVEDVYIETWPNSEARVTIHYMRPKRNSRSPSRAVRLENAVTQIKTVTAFYESLDEDHSDTTMQLEAITEEVEGLEIPSMYG